MGLKICFISDSHGQHNKIIVPNDIDIIISAGDITPIGTKSQVENFLNWFSSLPCKHKIFIAGNHDFWFDTDHPRNYDLTTEMALRGERLKIIPNNVIYLENSGCEIEGIKIWGSPVTPWFHDWAFNAQRGLEITKYWDLIPSNIDILITHGPPSNVGKLEIAKFNGPVGCKDLSHAINRVKPKISVFGHIHEGYGIFEGKIITDYNNSGLDHNIKFINASVLNLAYEMVNPPIIIDWDMIK